MHGEWQRCLPWEGKRVEEEFQPVMNLVLNRHLGSVVGFIAYCERHQAVGRFCHGGYEAVRLWVSSLLGSDWVEIQMATDQAQQDCALAALAGAVRGAMLCTQAQRCEKIWVLKTRGWVWVMCDVAYGAF